MSREIKALNDEWLAKTGAPGRRLLKEAFHQRSASADLSEKINDKACQQIIPMKSSEQREK
jgi:hypothetical protein